MSGSGASGGFGVGGVGADRTTFESELLWGAPHVRDGSIKKSVIISGAGRDAGNTITTNLRPGLILGKITATGLYVQLDADAADGTQFFGAVLDTEMRAIDIDGANANREFGMLVARAPIKARRLFIEGVAFIGHVDEFLLRRQMVAAHFLFDDDPQGYLAGQGYRFETNTTTAHTLVAADNGKTVAYSNVAAVLVTLPTIQPGLEYDLLRVADEEIVVASAEGDNIIVGNDMSADSVTVTTGGQQIGQRFRIKSVYVATTLKWIIELPVQPFGTGLTGGFAYSIAS